MQRDRRPRGREAACWLVLARVVLTVVPFRVIARYLGMQGRESTPTMDETAAQRALLVQQAIRTACRHLHWEPTCLVRALAATAMLRRAGLESTLYLGVARDPGQLRAHAWVRCGELLVVGGGDMPQFTVLNSFARAEA